MPTENSTTPLILPGSAAFLEILVDAGEVGLDDDGLVMPTDHPDCALCGEPLPEANLVRHKLCTKLQLHEIDAHGIEGAISKCAATEQFLRSLAGISWRQPPQEA